MSPKSIRQQFADTLLAVGQEDPNLVVLVGDISHFLLQPYAKACPGRYYNVGICEPTIVSMAAGLARTGFHPVVHTIAPFIVDRSFEQIKLDFCYQQLAGNLITVGSAFDYSNLGITHHCYDDFALIKALPGTEIVYPSTALEFDALFRQTYNDRALTLHRVPGTSHEVEFAGGDIQVGRGIRVAEGRNLTIVATGPQLRSALDARPGLLAAGWDAEVLYIHTIRPLDTALIRASVEKTRNVLVVEEHMTSGGLGDDVLRTVTGIPGLQYASLSIPDRFVTEYGTYEEQCERLGLTSGGIERKVREHFGARPPVKTA